MSQSEVEVWAARAAEVGGFTVGRMLPQRPRRTVGAWCFVDVMGPGRTTAAHGLDVGPHPHIGLQTVTWLVEGTVLHRDSLGSEQLIRPGQLNLMTAGHGVSHAEETAGIYEGPLHGIQLWVAQPESTRHGAPAFEHHAELPRVELEHATATVLVGRVGPVESPARRDTDHVGIELDLRPGPTTVPVEPTGEHGLAVVTGTLMVAGEVVTAGSFVYLAPGIDEVVVEVPSGEGTRALLLGGPPFPDELVMWWNYVARTREEVRAAHGSWSADDGRFGTVASPLARIDVAGPPWPAG